MISLKQYLRRRQIRQIRVRARAFRAFQRDGAAAFAHLDTARRMALIELPVPDWCGLGMVPKEHKRHVETLLRQKILNRVLFKSLLPELLASRHQAGRPVVIPVPPVWRQWLTRQGFTVSGWRCRMAWWKNQARTLASAVFQTARILFNIDHRPPAPPAGYAVLLNAPPNALPATPGDYDKALGLVRWYREHGLRLPQEEHNWMECPRRSGQWRGHQIDIVSHPLPGLRSARQRFRFLIASSRVLGSAILMTAIGAWWAPTLALEGIMLAHFRCLDGPSVASSYVFNNSSWIYRPLWTYEAEACGARVIMLFYSTNMQHLPWDDGRVSPIFPGYEIMSWSEYAVWNEEQRDFLVRMGHRDATYHICGRVDVEDTGDPAPEIPADTILVFDVSPFRPTRLAELGLVPPYYSSSNMQRFITDIVAAAECAGVNLVLKSKRSLRDMMDRDYRNLLDACARRKHVTVAAPTISIGRMPDNVLGAISIPFTSAALAAQQKGIRSIYYDPTAMVGPLGRSHAKSIAVLSNAEQLKAWMVELKAGRPPKASARPGPATGTG
ncbi:MAG: polysaccharide biosynthesis PFTS motif protein [Rhodospirillales bacterium]|tara:strand:- start:12222 stop:13883 length:1662 start_codon:yes stop_codon:yes gene_type:complete